MNINLELTDHCNLKCRMCSQSMRDEAHGIPHRFMEWHTWKAALQSLKAYPEDIELCPHWLGEPTIHPHFNKFMAYAFGKNIDNAIFREFRLHTNAVVFSKERARLLIELARLPFFSEDTFNFIHFSLDAYSSAAYLEVKGKDKRDQAYENIIEFLNMRSELKAVRPFVSMGFVIQEGNAHEAHEFLSFWSDIFAKQGVHFGIDTDWQQHFRDSIYFRRLNTGNQDQADALHRDTLIALGIPEHQLKRAQESF